MTTVTDTQNRVRIFPLRGLLLTRNVRGESFDLTDLKKWVNVIADFFKCEKADVFAPAGDIAVVRELLGYASARGLALSWRCDAEESIAENALAELARDGLHDLFLCPESPDSPRFAGWLDACEKAELKMRVQAQAPFDPDLDIETAAGRLARCAAVHVALYDPFHGRASRHDAARSRQTIRQMNDLTRAVAARGVEVNLVHLPFSLVDEDLLGHAVNWPQFFRDHQQYHQRSYLFARQMHGLGRHRARKYIEIQLSEKTSFHNLIDNLVLPFVLERPWLFFRVWAAHKLTKHLRLGRRRPAPLPESVPAAEAMLEAYRRKQEASFGPVAARCRFRHISDYDSEEFKRALPGIALEAVPGEAILDPMHFLRGQCKYCDALDLARLEADAAYAALTREARRIVALEAPTREISPESYDIQDHYTQHMPGAVRWFSFANAEMQSTPVARLEPPFTLGLTIGGGIAEFAGFSFGRHAKVLCPMLQTSHKLALHVDAAGRFVLLRDNVAVHPAEFMGVEYVPRRLAGLLEPRISMWNVDGQVITQALLLWQDKGLQPAPESVEYSALIVNSRYARRLQTALLALANQHGLAPGRLEVVVAYVPGIDPTDDILDSMALSYPELRIVRVPFAPSHARAKGFMINEAIGALSGKWVALLDADIIVPPDFLDGLDKCRDTAMFIAPDGRKMLDAATTARILLGQTRPWEAGEYARLLEGAGDYRRRESDNDIPVGFCQCVRRDVLDKIRYIEFNHFEGADWFFGKQVIEEFGKEARLEGMVMLHMDHGGSQWYGTGKQM